MDWVLFGKFCSSFIAFAIPLILVAYGGMFSEHSGIINIALEAIMIIGAMVGSLVCSAFNDAVISGFPSQLAMFICIISAGLGGAIFSLLLSFASIRLKADQTIAGIALNTIAPALFIITIWAVQGEANTNIFLPSWRRISLSMMGITSTSLPPFVNSLLTYSLNYLTTIVAVILIPLAAVILYKTSFGLRLRACGEHPQAADSVGINVYRMRYAGVTIGGFLAGVGGIAYVLVVSSSFDGQVAGYGFLALAVMIFGNWKPVRIILAALFFSLFTTISNMTNIIDWLPSFDNIAEGAKLYKLLPYLVTIFVLIFT
ncbi:MAG: ABC transporter permease, partial [Bacilli bacterium]|nr:ABC transporter permease [Bacilli bacterium]